jgi:hypothetical protein
MRARLFASGLLSVFAFTCWGLVTSTASGQEASKFSVAEGKLEFKAPSTWTKKMPKSRIIDVEYEAPAAKGDETPGRFTVMGAGGTIEANVDRWIGQFDQPDGGNTKDKAKIEKLKVSGQDVHWVDLSGTYKDSPGPFAGGKPVMRENYRMLAAIIQTKKDGNYFLKLYGPKATMAENEKAFRELVDSMQVKDK